MSNKKLYKKSKSKMHKNGKYIRGHKKIGGRKKGTQNKFTNLKDSFLDAFELIGGTKALAQWGKNNKKDFYHMVTKMLPRKIEATGEDGKAIVITIKDAK